MELASSKISLVLLLLLSFLCADFGTALDTIAFSQFIRDPEAIISGGNNFKLGFFSPGNSTNHYVGISYNKSSTDLIWVANRNKPLNDSSGIITISEDGNLVVLNGQRKVLWSSNISNSVNNTVAQLLDSGNLVLLDKNTGKSIWESFQEPTDTFLPGMRISTNPRTGEKVQLRSWKSPSDPSIGSFSAGIDPLNIPEIFIWNDSRPYWRSGPWNGRVFNGIPDMNSFYQDGFSLIVDNQEGTSYIVDNQEGTSYNSSAFANFSADFVLNSQGIVEERIWNDEKEDWEVAYRYPDSECDVYGRCGAFGNCDIQEKPICSCLGGFEPKNIEEWNRGNWTSGCVRRKQLQCERINKTGEVGEKDGFLKLGMMKLPDFGERSSTLEDDCRDQCLNNCSCIAYAYDDGIGCMVWREKLVDSQKLYAGGGDLYIRVADTELDGKDMKVIIIVPVIVGITTIAICAFFLWRWMAKRNGMKKNPKRLDKGEACTKLYSENKNRSKLQDLPLFTFEDLAAATNDFDVTNKLGQGGFGPVYKGKLHDGQEIAVKRLSKASGQGLEEFMNEVVVISKLQHRNLVRILGCCVEGEEKMLIYEYMPNKSLDAFLFDPLNHGSLGWRKRFNIIEGISRGILYLHRDSRLRIIHRDLKASNILLDEELDPKISDFGTARIFGGDQNQANTARVVGTYGYMPPEYAMEGRFSEKSDVFSFGVLLLEIVCGRRNTGFCHEDHFLSLPGFAWKLWNGNNLVAFIDPVISDSSFQSEILRCIHVGLLCVAESVKDRPSMSTVISMLKSEIVDLPIPKQPAFTIMHQASETGSSEQNQNRFSANNVTITVIGGR